MSRLEWEAKITEVFISKIPMATTLPPDQIRKHLANILKEYGEVSKLVLLPVEAHHTHRAALGPVRNNAASTKNAEDLFIDLEKPNLAGMRMLWIASST